MGVGVFPPSPPDADETGDGSSSFFPMPPFVASSEVKGRASCDARGVLSVEEEGEGSREPGSSAMGEGVEVISPECGSGAGISRCEGRAFARFEVEEG